LEGRTPPNDPAKTGENRKLSKPDEQLQKEEEGKRNSEGKKQHARAETQKGNCGGVSFLEKLGKSGRKTIEGQKGKNGNTGEG